MATMASKSPRGDLLAVVELDPDDLDSSLAQHVLVHSRRLAGDVLEDQDAHVPILSLVAVCRRRGSAQEDVVTSDTYSDDR